MGFYVRARSGIAKICVRPISEHLVCLDFEHANTRYTLAAVYLPNAWADPLGEETALVLEALQSEKRTVIKDRRFMLMGGDWQSEIELVEDQEAPTLGCYGAHGNAQTSQRSVRGSQLVDFVKATASRIASRVLPGTGWTQRAFRRQIDRILCPNGARGGQYHGSCE